MLNSREPQMAKPAGTPRNFPRFSTSLGLGHRQENVVKKAQPSHASRDCYELYIKSLSALVCSFFSHHQTQQSSQDKQELPNHYQLTTYTLHNHHPTTTQLNKQLSLWHLTCPKAAAAAILVRTQPMAGHPSHEAPLPPSE